jgi:Cu(I)/Ag(I) efflux system membrane fusion protein
MKKYTLLVIGTVAVLAMAGYFLYLMLFDSHAGHDQTIVQTQQAEIEYYTCTMHPSVRAQKPGKCPLCGMELTPVFRKGTQTAEQFDLTFTVTPAKQQLIGVKFDDAKVREIHKIIYAVGKVNYDERKLGVVNMRIGGWIQDLHVDFTGKFVKKGQPLFSLYSPELVSAQREFLIAKQALQPDEADAGLLQTARERLRLWNVTDDQIDQLEKRGEPETYLTIVSPISGYVIEKMVLKGMRVEPGMDLYKIANLSTVWVHADVYEYELPSVRTGQEATISLSTNRSEMFKGRVTYIYPTLNPETRTARIRVELPNPQNKIKPEMFANVELHVNLGRRLSIPESAVLHSGTREIVFVDKGDGIFEVRFVHLGTRAEGYYEITDGLADGERVVTSANFLIDAESKIQGVLQRLEGGATTAPVQHQH